MNEFQLGDALLAWATHGFTGASGWQVLLYILVSTHITIAAVTLFLHRAQAHRSLELGPIPSHFFRLWLWMATGQVTQEWVAVHRKHHARCETEDDPHSPQTRGLRTVLLRGAELYREEAAQADTLRRYGHGTPNDWLERHVYSRHTVLGVVLMLLINLSLFGALGLTVWALQMVWIPVHAAGIINGLAHFWGYRNFEAPDASTNISPVGFWIGGEELHNNHHTYPTSAKFSVKPWEFDLGWAYIRVLQALGMARVRKMPPRLKLGRPRDTVDAQTLNALIAHRYDMMATYAKAMRGAARAEFERLKVDGATQARLAEMRLVRRFAHRDLARVPERWQGAVLSAVQSNPQLAQWVAMREELRALWTQTHVSAEQLVKDLQAWCAKAESSGNDMLQAFSLRVRAALV